MTNRELITELLQHNLDAVVRLEVGGDGAVHSSLDVFVNSDEVPWEIPHTVNITSEAP